VVARLGAVATVLRAPAGFNGQQRAALDHGRVVVGAVDAGGGEGEVEEGGVVDGRDFGAAREMERERRLRSRRAAALLAARNGAEGSARVQKRGGEAVSFSPPDPPRVQLERLHPRSGIEEGRLGGWWARARAGQRERRCRGREGRAHPISLHKLTSSRCG